ncbi:hypothetical protein PAEVO_51370 [Paenibacillus sp. GM2FR]|nr:hypothetical protein PAEVO_51370 [Paenibacillus sp. GM2FR]
MKRKKAGVINPPAFLVVLGTETNPPPAYE